MTQATLAIVKRRVPIARDPENGPRRLVEAFLLRRSEATRRAYRTDLADFAAYLEVRSPAAAISHLISQGPGPANELGLSYKAAMVSRGLSAGTVNRRLSTLRSCLKMARTVGLCNFGLEVESEHVEGYRDTRGPGVEKIRAMIGRLTARAQQGKRQAIRDLAIVRLLFNIGLRRGEVASLDVGHFDREGNRLSIKGKARSEREWVSLSPAAKESLEGWLAVRGEQPGPLFTWCDRLRNHRRGDGRLSATSIWRLLRKFGIRPHGLRHSGATLVAERNGGNVVHLRAWGRWKSAEIAMKYVDNAQDRQGEMAALLDGVA